MLGRTVVSVVCALLLVAAFAGPSAARDLDLRDSRQDVWRIDDSGAESVAPAVTNGDITRTRFRHHSRDIVVVTRFVDLRRVGRYAKLAVRIKSLQGRYRQVEVVSAPGSRAGKVDVFSRSGRLVRCRARHRIDYETNAIRVSVPRTCLRTPRYVKLTAAHWWYSGTGNVYTDNPHNAQAQVDGWTGWVKAG